MFSFPNGLEYKYDISNKAFKTAFEFLKRKDLSDLEKGSLELENGVKVKILEYNSKSWEEST